MASAMIRLDIAKTICYNPGLNASEDMDYFSRYLNKRKYLSLLETMYYYRVSEITTGYLKILQFTWNEIKRGILLFGINNKSALRVSLTSAIKLLIYAITIPFFGSDFYLKRRGIPLNREEKARFSIQLSKLHIFNKE
jgi:hypothetical protein